MIAFADGAADVLVCTTIIESGLDIPNANTIVIDRADTLGPRPALPAPRPGRPVVAARLRLPPLPPPRAALRRGAQAPPGDLQRLRAGRRLPDRPVRPRDPRRRQHPRRRAVRATWPPSASTSTRGCWPRRSRRGRPGARTASRCSRSRGAVARPADRGPPARRLRARRGPEARALPAARPGPDAGRPGRLPPGGHRPVRPAAAAGPPPRRGRRAAAGRRDAPASRRSPARTASSSSASGRACRGRRRCGSSRRWAAASARPPSGCPGSGRAT